jgi:hypothetical protein
VAEWRPWHLRCLVKRGMAIIAQERSTAKLEARTRSLRRPPATIRIGNVPLMDAAPLIAADAFGYFEQTGPRVSLEEELGWGSIRERILYGELDAAHAPGGPLFSILLGIEVPPRSVQTDPVLNLEGNAITLSRRVWQKGVFLEGCCFQLPGVEINAAREVKGVANNRPWSSGRILCVFQSPEGRKENSPGLQPWEPHANRNRPERAAGAMRHSQRCDTSILPFGRPFRAILFPYAFPGLKAWAIVFSPFGRSAERPNYSGRCKHRPLQGSGNAQTTSGHCNPPRRTLQNFSHWIEMLWR